jgi:adenylate cyclase
LVEQYHGTWIDETADGSLSSFSSAVDAVNCALAIQAELREGSELKLRIGIHLGETLVESGRVYGDGVNIASRVHTLAEPGGICVSDEVQHSIKNQPNIEAQSLGQSELENVDRPVEVFAISGAAEAPRPFVRAGPRTGVWAASAVGALLVIGLALWSLNRPDEPTVPRFAGQPAIAVLPFDNLSGDPEQSVFAEGLAEDLITRLAGFRSFPVIARGSSFDPDLPEDVQQVGRELDARYVVEGSVREAGQRVRVVVQAIDATTGRHVWANQYDRDFGDMLALQDEITEAIVAAMSPELLHSEIESAVHQDPRTSDAWNAAMRGWWHFNRATKHMTEEDMDQARKLFERAIELDPQWGDAWAGLALTHSWDIAASWSDSRERSIRELLEAAEKAVTLDGLSAQAHHALGHAYVLTRQRDRVLGAFAEGAELNPSDHLANNCYGQHLALLGKPDAAIERLTYTMSLSPRDPLAFAPRVGMAWAYFAGGDYERALEWAEESNRRRPNNVYGDRIAAASAGQLGDLERARKAMREADRVVVLTKETFENAYGIATPDFQERMIEGLRQAGWNPEAHPTPGESR